MTIAIATFITVFCFALASIAADCATYYSRAIAALTGEQS